MFSTCVDCPDRAVAQAGVRRGTGGDCRANPEVAAADDIARPEGISEARGLRIVAPSYRVNIGAVIQLEAIGSSNQGAPIQWSIEEGSSGGSVSDSGVYQAPVAPGVYHVVASDGVERARIEIRVFTVQ
jgi:hypothetical protein